LLWGTAAQAGDGGAPPLWIMVGKRRRCRRGHEAEERRAAAVVCDEILDLCT
jgi:hypothetical protein